jgi:hypothetical protein
VQTIFTLSSGRSGTHFLYELVRRNAAGCIARHETYGFNPSMFGRPIFDYATGEQEATQRLLERKRRMIDGYRTEIYVETSHAFLKSWFHLAPQFFPQLSVVHLVRDPLYVAKSEAAREEFIKRFQIPFCHYRGSDAGRYFLWSLTGLEPIFRHFDGVRLSRLQWYVIQWIEIENRAMRFLAQFPTQCECFTLESPAELNSAKRVTELFGFLRLKIRRNQLHLEGRRNRNWRRTIITEQDRQQLADVVRILPGEYLEIFRHEPYRGMASIESLSLLR